MKHLALFIAIILVIPVYGQRRKKDDDAGPVYVEGVVYALPRTVIKVQVQAVKETFTPGPYNAYAEQLLGIKNAKSQPEVNWQIQKIEMETYAEPDPSQVHKAMGDAAFLVNLSPNGCLAGINSGTATQSGSEIITNQIGQSADFQRVPQFANFTDTPFFMTGDSTNGFRPVRVSADQKMAEAVQRILDSRRFQLDLASGMMDEFHPDGEAYKVSLKELKKTEENYLSLFVGKYTFEKGTFSFDFVPERPGGKAEAIFRISEDNGIVPPGDLSGTPVMIEFEAEKELVQKYSEMAKSANPAAGESGIYYRMPGVANIKIINDLNVIATSRATIAQFGVVAPLPEELLFGEFSVELHPETGAIKNIKRNGVKPMGNE